MTKLEITVGAYSGILVILASSLLRHSSFVIRHFYDVRSS